jgi:hypothetical protein
MVSAIDPTGHKPQIRLWLLLSALAGGFFYTVGFGLFIAAVVVADKDVSPWLFVAGWCVLMLGAVLVYVKFGLALWWLHAAWKWVPMDQRYMRDGKRIQPGEVFMLLIPYCHFYWMFPVNLGLCDAMERMRAQWVREPRMEPPPRDTAMWAAICEIIPFANFYVAPFLWSSYMRRIDQMHEEIGRAYRPQGAA